MESSFVRAARRVGLLVSLLVLGSSACSTSRRPSPTAGARIVSLSPATTEALFAVGAGAEVVGRSRYCDMPPEARALPVIGGYADPNLEAILALTPSLVVGSRGPGGAHIAQQLEARGIAVFFPVTDSFADVETLLGELGRKTGHAELGARAAASLHTEVVAAEAELAGRPSPRVLLVLGLTPVVSAGPGSFPDEMLRRAHGRNVIVEGGTYPTLPFERIVALDPDVVVNLASGEDPSPDRISTAVAGWRELRAVQQGHVVTVTDDAALRPGPRLAQGLRALGRAIHSQEAR